MHHTIFYAIFYARVCNAHYVLTISKAQVCLRVVRVCTTPVITNFGTAGLNESRRPPNIHCFNFTFLFFFGKTLNEVVQKKFHESKKPTESYQPSYCKMTYFSTFCKFIHSDDSINKSFVPIYIISIYRC